MRETDKRNEGHLLWVPSVHKALIFEFLPETGNFLLEMVRQQRKMDPMAYIGSLLQTGRKHDNC